MLLFIKRNQCLAGRHARCTRLGRRSPGAMTAPEGEDHVKVQASLGCKRNIMPPLVLFDRCVGARPLSNWSAVTLPPRPSLVLLRPAGRRVLPRLLATVGSQV